jgi:hypothetical protein
MRRLVRSATLILFAASAVGCETARPPEPIDVPTPAQTASSAPTPLKPIVLWWGAHSGVDQRDYWRVATDDAWKALWLRHAGEQTESPLKIAKHPEVDFERCVVVAIFAGKLRNTSGLTIASIEESDDRVLVRFERQSKSYQTGPDADDVTPYAILVLPKTRKPIVLEEDVHSLIGAAPQWKERARLE